MPSSWKRYMVERVQGREQGVPRYLNDKLECYEFCKAFKIPTVEVLRVFSSPADIDLSGLPQDFVLKPTHESSMRGVMVLTRRDGLFFEAFLGTEMSSSEIVRLQSSLYGQTALDRNHVIVEKRVVDAYGYTIPRDVKAYAFRGILSLIAVIDRNTRPATVAWYDGAFRPIDDDRVVCNPKYATRAFIEAPDRASELLSLARRASSCVPSPFARIDMYVTERGPVVGEITLTPGGFYYGLHYALSGGMDVEMGELWARGIDDLQQHRAALGGQLFGKSFEKQTRAERELVESSLLKPHQVRTSS